MAQCAQCRVVIALPVFSRRLDSMLEYVGHITFKHQKWFGAQQGWWINHVREKIGDREANLQWVDCGDLGDWGTPLSFKNRDNFKNYALAAWAHNIKPDTVLIDGRFRVYCFLTCLKYASEGAGIIFDDYTNRPHYHIVEEFVPRSETCGRQCLFIVPSKQNIDFALLDRMIDTFEYVME